MPEADEVKLSDFTGQPNPPMLRGGGTMHKPGANHLPIGWGTTHVPVLRYPRIASRRNSPSGEILEHLPLLQSLCLKEHLSPPHNWGPNKLPWFGWFLICLHPAYSHCLLYNWMRTCHNCSIRPTSYPCPDKTLTSTSSMQVLPKNRCVYSSPMIGASKEGSCARMQACSIESPHPVMPCTKLLVQGDFVFDPSLDVDRDGFCHNARHAPIIQGG